ncbi:YlbF family regulator [Paenibacillaceae bacterium]|nr:YlbF family regulator [Paenibacillaceae bacterium]
MPTAEVINAGLSAPSVYHGETTSLDMAGLLLNAYELGDMINHSADVADYAYWKAAVADNTEVQQLILQFRKAKELFEECQRFGRYHPNFHEAKNKVKEIERLLDGHECVTRFKAAEQAIDELLYEVSRTIALAVSESVKVPGNDSVVGGGCGSGGSCSCGSGGCG